MSITTKESIPFLGEEFSNGRNGRASLRGRLRLKPREALILASWSTCLYGRSPPLAQCLDYLNRPTGSLIPAIQLFLKYHLKRFNMRLQRSLFVLSFTALRISAYSGCSPDGPLLPRPQKLAQSTAIQNATSQLQSSLDKALSGNSRAGWSVENTSFSIGFISADSEVPIWEYHHRGAANINGTYHTDGDTQYLVGSISKLITDMLVLRTGIDLDVPVTQYLPQLSNESSIISWENITLASLADHLSGIPPNYGFSEWYFLQPLLEQLGFPPLSVDAYEECGIAGLNGACSEERKLGPDISTE